MLDLDYFRVPLVAGRFYWATITSTELQDCCLSAYYPQESSVGGRSNAIGWWQRTDGERYFVAFGSNDRTGSYTFEVTVRD